MGLGSINDGQNVEGGKLRRHKVTGPFNERQVCASGLYTEEVVLEQARMGSPAVGSDFGAETTKCTQLSKRPDFSLPCAPQLRHDSQPPPVLG
ncbi:hypothetical protein DHEL01_v210665 [Diaporthe helianthi]|uniref:Uncharacterized protein n=1 Tax=Diaporthe helianthi TaxID=158607 RepID=A0A2P5HL20_DIAHE|nr:hypothetical protein DHEL01_v210665 [Diaporthe helianthi]